MAACLLACQLSLPQAAEKAAPASEMLIAVTVNDKNLSDAVLVLTTPDRRIYVPARLLTDARLRLPSVPQRRRREEDYYPLDAIPGLRAELEAATQTLHIDAPAAAFVSTQFDLNNRSPTLPETSATGAFVNYDLNYGKDQLGSNLAGLLELGVFSAGGTFTSRFVGQDLSGNRTLFRLDSQYARDFPEQLATLVLGDGITGASTLAQQVYFGGLQWKTKFSTDPGYQAIPLPTLTGTATAPSVVDVYVDNILRLRQPVDTGPFALSNLPVFTGQGNVQMVVRDVLGRQQVYSQSYITSAQLLRQGARDVSFELGALRNGFGLKDNDYGRSFSSGTWRYGLSNASTIESHAEIMRGSQTLGLAATRAVDRIGLFSSGVSASRSALGGDTQQFVQFNRQSSDYGLTLRAQTAGAHYRQLGLDDQNLAPARLIQAQTGVAAGRNTSLSFGYIGQVNRSQPDVRALNGGVSINLRAAGILTFGLFKTLTQDRQLSANLVWTLPLENQRLLQVAANAQPGSRNLSADYQQGTAAEGGWGYRLRKTVLDGAGEDAGLNYLGTNGEYRLSANHVNGQNNLQMGARGGIAILGGHMRAARWLDESFAMVEVPTREAVDIYANHVKVGQTDENGIGFIPRLVPYQVNQINLDDAGLPLAMSLELAGKSVVPMPRSGVLLRFNAKLQQSATLILVDEGGQPLPTGARVRQKGQTKEQEVALRGQVFMPEIAFPVTILVEADRTRCSIDIEAPQKMEAFPLLGPYVCRQET